MAENNSQTENDEMRDALANLTEAGITGTEPTSSGTVAVRALSDDVLVKITNMSELMNALGEAGIAVTFSEELGDGFAPYEKNKRTLVGVRMFILSVRRGFSDDYTDENGEPAPFSVIRFLIPGPNALDTAQKYFLTDGSTGIHKQLSSFLAVNGNDTGSGMVAMWAPYGLRESEYDLPDGTGKGTTYYIDTRGTGGV